MLVSSALISGLGLGSMYGLLALGFHVTYAVSNTVNFAQGSAMMLGAVLCFSFWITLHWPLTVAVLAALALCALWGAVVEIIAVRPFVRRNSNAWLMATPLFTISSTMGTLFGIKAFAVAILGGIGSAWGVVLAGLIYGVAEALIIALAGSTYSQIATFTLVILALALRPNELFGRAPI